MSGEESHSFPTLAVVGSIAGVGFASIVRSRPAALHLDGLEPSVVAILGMVAVVVAAFTFLYALREAWRGEALPYDSCWASPSPFTS